MVGAHLVEILIFGGSPGHQSEAGSSPPGFVDVFKHKVNSFHTNSIETAPVCKTIWYAACPTNTHSVCFLIFSHLKKFGSDGISWLVTRSLASWHGSFHQVSDLLLWSFGMKNTTCPNGENCFCYIYIYMFKYQPPKQHQANIYFLSWK